MCGPAGQSAGPQRRDPILFHFLHDTQFERISGRPSVINQIMNGDFMMFCLHSVGQVEESIRVEYSSEVFQIGTKEGVLERRKSLGTKEGVLERRKE